MSAKIVLSLLPPCNVCRWFDKVTIYWDFYIHIMASCDHFRHSSLAFDQFAEKRGRSFFVRPNEGYWRVIPKMMNSDFKGTEDQDISKESV